MISHANNEEFEAATSLSEALLETHQSEQEQNRKVYGQLMINHGIIQSTAKNLITSDPLHLDE